MLFLFIATILMPAHSTSFAAETAEEIEFIYQDVLGRPAGTNETSYWQSTGLKGEDLRKTIVNSASGSDRAAMERYINAQKGIPQNADPAVKAAIDQAKRDGIAARKAMERGEDISSQAKKYLPDANKRELMAPHIKTSIAQAYREVLNREPDQAGLDYWQKQVESGAVSLEQLKGILANSPEAREKAKGKVRSAI